MMRTQDDVSADNRGLDQVTAHVDDVESNNTDNKHVLSTQIAPVPKHGWHSHIWDSLDKSLAERRLVFKLDCALLTIGCLGYFVKFLDQVNINNAFVSGMKEDLNMYGNELDHMQTAWGVGYLLGGLPNNILLTCVRPSLFIPTIECIWGVLTLCLTACKSYKTMCVVRFFVGLFESVLYCHVFPW